MQTFDLAISYVWEYDSDFVKNVEIILQQSGFTTYMITDSNIAEVTELVKSKKLNFLTYIDRASDVDDDFFELARMLTKRKVRIFNPYKNIEHAIDKATMHLEFITAGIHVPYSIILPPQNKAENIFISLNDLEVLGRPFIIKPCNTTGGGIGVVTGAETLKEVISARDYHQDDKYIIQEKIIPQMIGEKRAWFRCFWAFGKPIATWWDDETHIYEILTNDEIRAFKLNKLLQITRTIFKITKLDFFSTEIAFTNKNKFVVIDYVNDQCDMRYKSLHADGVPDEIITEIIMNLKNEISKEKRYKR